MAQGQPELGPETLTRYAREFGAAAHAHHERAHEVEADTAPAGGRATAEEAPEFARWRTRATAIVAVLEQRLRADPARCKTHFHSLQPGMARGIFHQVAHD